MLGGLTGFPVDKVQWEKAENVPSHLRCICYDLDTKSALFNLKHNCLSSYDWWGNSNGKRVGDIVKVTLSTVVEIYNWLCKAHDLILRTCEYDITYDFAMIYGPAGLQIKRLFTKPNSTMEILKNRKLFVAGISWRDLKVPAIPQLALTESGVFKSWDWPYFRSSFPGEMQSTIYALLIGAQRQTKIWFLQSPTEGLFTEVGWLPKHTAQKSHSSMESNILSTISMAVLQFIP